MALPNSIIAGSYPLVAPSEYPGVVGIALVEQVLGVSFSSL